MFSKRLKIGLMFLFKPTVEDIGCILWIITGKTYFTNYNDNIKKLSKKYHESKK